MDEYEECEIKKQKSEKEKSDKNIKSKCDKKRRKHGIEKEHDDGEKSVNKVPSYQRKKRDQKTTTDLISFLKDLIEADQKKKDVLCEDKSVSPHTSEIELASMSLGISYDNLIQEDDDDEEEEEEEDEEVDDEEEDVENEGEEENDEKGEGEGLGGEEDGMEEGIQESMQDTEITSDKEGFVDMEEVKKKLEEFQSDEEGEFQQKPSDVSEETGESPLSLSYVITDSDIKEPLTQEKSAQFNYFEERKALLKKKPKNITDDLSQFMKTMILSDDNMRVIMKEKELLEFKRKQLDFMTMGMLLKKPLKSKNKNKCKKGKGKKTSYNEDSEDLLYKVRPNEFMIMLEVVMNSLNLMDDYKNLQHELLEKRILTESSSTQYSETTDSSSFTDDYDEGEADESEDGEGDENEDEDENGDDDDDDDDEIAVV